MAAILNEDSRGSGDNLYEYYSLLRMSRRMTEEIIPNEYLLVEGPCLA